MRQPRYVLVSINSGASRNNTLKPLEEKKVADLKKKKDNQKKKIRTKVTSPEFSKISCVSILPVNSPRI